MSLGGSRMSALDHWITHSILINLFIKPGLNNFLLPPLLSIIFVQGCSIARYTFRNEVGHFGLMRFSFVKIFLAYRLILTRRWKLVEVFTTVVMYQSQQHGRRGQSIDTRHPGRQSRDINSIYMGEVKLVAFFFATDGFHSFSLVVEYKVSLNSY